MKVVRLDSTTFPVHELERKYLREMGFTEIVEIEGTTPDEIIEAGRDAEAIIVISNYLRANVIDELKNCKAIIRKGTGCDKIDLDRATEKGIIVTNLPDFANQDVADHAILLMLAVARKLPVMQKSMETRDWINVKIQNELTRIEGKTMGLVGFGNIGKKVAVRAKAFGMNVVDYHRNVNPEVEESYGVKPVSFETLLKISDFIVLTCPLTKETYEMIGEKEINMMKPTAILVNVARGAVCDEKALAEALRNKRIAGAGIDVYEHINVFAPADGQPQCLYDGLDNVILTPHCAADSKESKLESIEKSMEQLRMIVQGIFPTNCVNTDVYEKVKEKYRKI